MAIKCFIGCPWAVGDDEEEEALDDLEDHASFLIPQDNYAAYQGEHTSPKYSRRDLYQKPHIPRLACQQEVIPFSKSSAARAVD